jgi:hypothetical protein
MLTSPKTFQLNKEIKRHIIIPLWIILLVLITLIVVSFLQYGEKQLNQQVHSQTKTVATLFDAEWKRDALLFENIIDEIKNDTCMQSAFVANNRERLPYWMPA